jgi:WD40 repeat protein/serine/threonine protein kinase
MNDNDYSPADPVGQIADEFVEAFRQGKRPSVEEFARRYPEHADEIREMLPALVIIEQARAAQASVGSGPAITAVVAVPVRQLGDYQILREVGRGGMGVVYEAQQLSLGRHVAIKVLPSHALLDPRQLSRFQREARSAAKLHHTNIVPVFGIGEQEGLHYFVMQFIQGLDELRRLRHPRGKEAPIQGHALGHRTDRARGVSAMDVARGLLSGEFRLAEPAHVLTTTPEPAALSNRAADTSATIRLPGQSETSTLNESGSQYWQSVARIGMQVADALAHAASQGVLHRDIKPSNLLLDSTGTVWVTDFGLAKGDSDIDNLTHTGDVVGTLRYMAPERFNGKGDLRSDVYSLGLTLYELLALRPAFDERNRNGLVKQVMHDEPVRPRKLNPSVPRDLETVVLKAIARDPAHRYQTPAEMAEDLKRFVEDRPVKARRVSEGERLWRWCRRNPGIAVLGGVLTLVLVLVTVASLLIAGYFNRLRWAESEQRQRAELETQRADDEARRVSEGERVARNLAHAEGEASKLARQETQRAEAEKKRAEEQLKRAEWLIYVGKLSLAQNDFEAGNGGFAFQYLDECQWNLRGWEHRYLWSRINARQTFRGHTGPVWSVAFSPDGKRILTGGQDTTARVWDVDKSRELLVLRGHSTPVRGVAFSPDGNRIVTGAGAPGKPGEAKVWDAGTGKKLLALAGLSDEVWGVAFSPDGKRIVTGAGNRSGHPGEVKMWDAGTGKELLALTKLATCVSSVAFSPDGKRILTGDWGSAAKLWDAATGQELLALKGHTFKVWSVAFSPDGKRIVTGAGNRSGHPGEVKMWDAGTGKELLALTKLATCVSSVAFSPDGKRILTGGWGSAAKLWDAATGQELFTLKGNAGELSSVVFSPDGKRIVTAGEDGTVRVWNAEKGQKVLALKGHTAEILSVAFSPNGKCIFTGSRDRTARVWDTATGIELLTVNGHTAEVNCVTFSPDGKRIVTGRQDSTARVLDAQTGQEVLVLKGHKAQVISVAFSSDGKRIVTGSYDRTAKVWDAATGQELLALKGLASWVPQLDFYRGYRARQVLEQLAVKGHTSWVWGVAFSPDGKRIVTASEDRTVRVWDARTGQEIHTLRGHTGIVWSVAYSPGGTRIVSSSDDRTARVWDAATGKEVLVLKGHTAPVFSAVFSPDGKRIVTGAGDLYRPGETKLWDAATGQEVLTIKGHTGRVRSVAFSPDGKRIVTGSEDGTAKVWVADRAQEVLVLKGHTANVNCIAFSPDGKRIFAWDIQNKVLAWSAADGKPISPVDPPPAPRPGPARSPDGSLHAVPHGNTVVVTSTN